MVFHFSLNPNFVPPIHTKTWKSKWGNSGGTSLSQRRKHEAELPNSHLEWHTFLRCWYHYTTMEDCYTSLKHLCAGVAEFLSSLFICRKLHHCVNIQSILVQNCGFLICPTFSTFFLSNSKSFHWKTHKTNTHSCWTAYIPLAHKCFQSILNPHQPTG